MAHRKIRDSADAHTCLAAAAASGQLPRVWARAHGVDGRSLYWWRLRLAAEQPTLPRMVELVPTPMSTAAPAPPALPDRYLVHLGGFTVEVGERFDEQVLARVLRAVASC